MLQQSLLVDESTQSMSTKNTSTTSFNSLSIHEQKRLTRRKKFHREKSHEPVRETERKLKAKEQLETYLDVIKLALPNIAGNLLMILIEVINNVFIGNLNSPS